MVQIQSSWFPLVDLNPQTFVDIPTAKPTDFKKATERVYRSKDKPSDLTGSAILSEASMATTPFRITFTSAG